VKDLNIQLEARNYASKHLVDLKKRSAQLEEEAAELEERADQQRISINEIDLRVAKMFESLPAEGLAASWPGLQEVRTKYEQCFVSAPSLYLVAITELMAMELPSLRGFGVCIS
jgi:hypothetical protein